jgi:GntR family transcriptional regulator
VSTPNSLKPNLEIRLSSADGVPVYRQIINQVKYMVASGRLQTGQELPPIRVLAERLVINPNTVVRAYMELQREEVIESRQGSGTYVMGNTPATEPDARKVLEPKIDSLLADATHLNFSFKALSELLKERQDLINKGNHA